MPSCGHHPAPLTLRHNGERSCKTREDDPADHGIHLEAQPAGPFSSTIGMMRPAPHWFQFVACGDSQCCSCRSSPPSRAAGWSPVLPSPKLFPCNAMCYNRPAVERTAKWEANQVLGEPVQAAVQTSAALQDLRHHPYLGKLDGSGPGCRRNRFPMRRKITWL